MQFRTRCLLQGALLSSVLSAIGCATATDSNDEATATDVGTSQSAFDLDPELFAPRWSRDAYLKSRLEKLIASNAMGIVPALGGALAVDGVTQAAAVAGVRTYGSPDPAKVGDYFSMGSVGKIATAYIAAKFVERGNPIGNGTAFSWNTKLFDVLGDLQAGSNEAYANLTVAQLLSHNTGMPNVPTTEPADQWASDTPSVMARRIKYVKAALADAPSSANNYSGGSIIVAAMIERLTGKPWEYWLDTMVAQPLGMTNTGPGQAPFPASNSFTSVHDRGTNGIPVPWSPPPGIDVQTNSPAGNLHGSMVDMVRLAGAYMHTSANRPGGLSAPVLQQGLTVAVGTSGYTTAGWNTAPSYWDGRQVFWKNGSYGMSHALIYLSTQDRYAMSTAASANVGDAGCNLIAEAIIGLKNHLQVASVFNKTKTIGVQATASSQQPGFEASKAVDGNLDGSTIGRSAWAIPTSLTGGQLTLTLPFAQSISQIRIAEEEGKVTAFYIEALVNGAWTTVASGGTLGPNYAASFPAVSTYKLRVTVAGRGSKLAEVWAY